LLGLPHGDVISDLWHAIGEKGDDGLVAAKFDIRSFLYTLRGLPLGNVLSDLCHAFGEKGKDRLVAAKIDDRSQRGY
jgi:hypothetical protein